MKLLNRVIRAAVWGAVCLGSGAPAGERARAEESFTRRVTFELTYANRDLIWLDDPASPTSLVYAKPDARPVASDICVTRLGEKRMSPHRHYVRSARISDESPRVVYAFTDDREKRIGTIDDQDRFLPDPSYASHRDLLPNWPIDTSVLAYDAQQNALYREVDLPGPVLFETLDFLPLELVDSRNNAVGGLYSIDYAPPDHRSSGEPAQVTLRLQLGSESVLVAKASVPNVIRRADVRLGSFDNAAGVYQQESAYRPGGGGGQRAEPTVTISIAGEFAPTVQSDGEHLALVDAPPASSVRTSAPQITIDGSFDDWRNVPGVDDPRGDLAPYLDYVPDVDLLEFKVAHDQQHIYFYARVAGQVGRTHPKGGRSYFYAYMDVDRDAGTGFLPTRDDDCYFGVDIGDDCEVQFEFVNNRFRKTFYGFCGLGGDEDVLKQQVTIGKSHYSRFDDRGVERAHYKSEYIYRKERTEITEDLKAGTSDSIRLAVSPDGSEVEVCSTLAGFLKDVQGHPTVQIGQTIDVTVGMESDSKAYPGKTRWGADSSAAIRGYELCPAKRPDLD